MRAHLKYLQYVFRHKWFVFLACLRLRVPLWRAVVHDWTKFMPREWFPYVHQFFNPDGTPRSVRDASGAYDPNAQPIGFKYAWLHHQRNPHHWQAWVSIGDSGNLDPLPMPEGYAREMIADWIGAGRAQGKCDPHGWYAKNANKMILHPDTRAWIEQELEAIKCLPTSSLPKSTA